MSSLQDQLLKAGLTTKQKARQANTEKRKKQKQKQSGQQVEATLQEKIQQDLKKSQQEKQAKDAQLNEQRKQALAEKEAKLRIVQILQHHQLKNVEGEQSYNYTFNNKVKKIYLDEMTYNALVNGRLALCGIDEQVFVVTAETAEKVASLEPTVLLVQNDKVESDLDEDDPYAEYQIPDDLMW
ncbi:DUF2058 domain-containing protein [Thalassotalea marina]|uniref:DUF2058 domain-containing protein n=1 Tax=Thalassotalea marina TaxID=1673741 RepID=A0A919BEN7_9GAMM|nr:DUF2058 domain-containing protein [Thalassotalea marina]GHF83673.1 hypothetical protein GCM10017161_08710 [Thalassotalea marina]